MARPSHRCDSIRHYARVPNVVQSHPSAPKTHKTSSAASSAPQAPPWDLHHPDVRAVIEHTCFENETMILIKMKSWSLKINFWNEKEGWSCTRSCQAGCSTDGVTGGMALDGWSTIHHRNNRKNWKHIRISLLFVILKTFNKVKNNVCARQIRHFEQVKNSVVRGAWYSTQTEFAAWSRCCQGASFLENRCIRILDRLRALRVRRIHR